VAEVFSVLIRNMYNKYAPNPRKGNLTVNTPMTSYLGNDKTCVLL